MTNECPKCHTENTSDSQFCKKCATPLPHEVDITEPFTKTLETPVIDLTRGATFADRYEIIEELGKGGMGKVYRVEDKKVKEEVALKLIRPEIASDKKTIERFRNELKTTRMIAHKNVCRMFDLGEDKGIHYITMEYVSGQDLKGLIRQSAPLSSTRTISIAEQICDGLAEAHSLGVIHRDLKPANIMIDKEGNIRIMDFGIARSIRTESITGTGMAVGTPDYMSPEQAEAKKVDQRSDLYSLGVILYEMVTGQTPFKGDTPLSVAMKHKSEIPKNPKDINAQIPESTSNLILRCMEKKKEDRYQTVTELKNKLQQLKVEDTGVKERRKFSKLLTPKIKRRKKKPSRFKNKILRYSLRFLIILLIVYGVISAFSLFNDIIYKGKIQRIKVERITYYKNLFPIQKDWLPEEWGVKNCNSYNTYLRLFPQRYDEEGNFISEEEYLKDEYVRGVLENPSREYFSTIFNDFEYNSVQDLRAFVNKYEKYYKFDELFDALRCSKLNLSQFINYENMLYDVRMMMNYIRMSILMARIDFLEGSFDKGLEKLYNASIFSLDLASCSRYLMEVNFTQMYFNFICKELITFFLSQEVGSKSNINFPWDKMITLSISKFDPELVLYREYLYMGIELETNRFRPEDYYVSNISYYFLGKLMFWRDRFSIRRHLYKAGEFYRGLFEGLKYLQNFRSKSLYMKDYTQKNAPPFNLFIGDSEGRFLRFNITRTIGKLTLIIMTVKSYGIDSPEFLALEKTDNFINELSGRSFEIIKEGEETFIVVSEDFKINLKKIDYQKDHKDILKSFEHFNIMDDEQFRLLFYSYELE